MTAQKFWTVGQIDATGVRGPHEKELEDISNHKIHNFKNLDMNTLKSIISNDLGGKLENIGFNEDWTISLEMFPEVNIHLSYSYFGDEFGEGIEAEFKFYFSGKHVTWVPGEDSATYIDIIMDFIERQIKGQPPFEKSYNSHTELMQKVLKQRAEPFKLLKEPDRDNLARFIGGDVRMMNDDWHIKKEMFPKIYEEVIWNRDKGLDIHFSGENLEKIGSYHIELVGIFFINHILRYITINNEDKTLDNICYLMFSRYFTKQKNWDHRRV